MTFHSFPTGATGARPEGSDGVDPHLRQVFQDLFGRPPLPAEVLRWASEPREDLVAWALGTASFWEHWLEEELYYFLLIDGFAPPPDELEALTAELAAGTLGVIEALHRICLSASFDRRNPGPDTFVTVVMEQLLGEEVQSRQRELAIGKRIYDGASGVFFGTKGASQADVVRIAIELERATGFFLAREYRRMLRAEPAPAALEGWTKRLRGEPGAFAGILREWLASPAYAARLAQRQPIPNRLFVSTLYVDLFARVPSKSEAQQLRAALDAMADSAPLRELIARLLLDSGKTLVPEKAAVADPRAWIEGAFRTLLAREPAPDELAVFLESFAASECRPATVLLAIVSHPEYQSW